jgi:hypothetical protein
MINFEERFEKWEKMTKEERLRDCYKNTIGFYLNYVRREASQGTFTLDQYIDAFRFVCSLMDWAGLSPEENSPEIEAVRKTVDGIPLFRMAVSIVNIASDMNKSGGIDKTHIAESVAALIEEGMTRKEIKKAVNKHLTVEKRKEFTEVLDELIPADYDTHRRIHLEAVRRSA